MPDLDPVARSSSDHGPAKWAAVGLLGGAALVALAWAALGRAPAPPRPSTPAPAAPPSAPIVVVNVPPPLPAADSAPAPDPTPLGPPAQPPITVTPAPPSAPHADPATPAKAAHARINLNSASLDELDLLPGVGKATAQAILDYRTKHGKFRTVSELDKVPGIGPSKLEKLRPLVTVD